MTRPPDPKIPPALPLPRAGGRAPHPKGTRYPVGVADSGEFASVFIRRGQTHFMVTALLAAISLAFFGPSPALAEGVPNNVSLYVITREVLFFSAQAGVWTSVRLDAGERILQRAADTNVAAVITNQRAIGFSAVLNLTHEIRLPDDETLESFKVEGNVATALTRRRALGFSAATGKWSDVERFQPGR